MAKVYADLIRKGMKTMADVPEQLQKGVAALLEDGNVKVAAMIAGNSAE